MNLVNFMHKLFKTFIFWLILIGVGVFLILTRISQIFIDSGFTAEEGFFLSFTLTLPFTILIVIFYKKLRQEATLPSILKCLRPSHLIINGWEGKFLVTLIALFSAIKVYKYLQAGDLAKVLTMILIPLSFTYIFLTLLNLNLQMKKNRVV